MGVGCRCHIWSVKPRLLPVFGIFPLLGAPAMTYPRVQPWWFWTAEPTNSNEQLRAHVRITALPSGIDINLGVHV